MLTHLFQDIDGLWIDMNEAANFCEYPCLDPEGSARQAGDPPRPPAIRPGPPYPIPGFPADFQPQCNALVRFQVLANTLVISSTSFARIAFVNINRVATTARTFSLLAIPAY